MFKKILRQLELWKSKIDGWQLDRDLKSGKKLRGRQLDPNTSEAVESFRDDNTSGKLQTRMLSRASIRMDILRVNGTRESIEVPGIITSTE